MKKAIILLLCAAALAGCSKSERPEIPGTDPGTDPSIRLQAGLSAESKAPVNMGDNFTAAVAGWETVSTVNYATAKSWLSTASVTASASATTITLTPAQTYAPDVAVKTYMKAWYPAGTLSDDGQVTFAGDGAYAADGTTDVLLARQAVGAANDADSKTLAFAHPLTQLKFKVAGNASFGTATTLTSLTVKNAQVPIGIDLTTDAITYGAGADLSVPGITDGAITITGTEAQAGSPVMIKPCAGKTFRLDIVTSASTYSDVLITIDDDASFVPGRAYAITLTFGGMDVAVGSTVDEWISGTGSGQIIN